MSTSISQNKPMGHLSLKSSALCPSGGKLTNQYLAAEQLMAHNKKIKSTKAYVDTSMPKALKLSQKYKDQQLRNGINKEFIGHLINVHRSQSAHGISLTTENFALPSDRVSSATFRGNNLTNQLSTKSQMNKSHDNFNWINQSLEKINNENLSEDMNHVLKFVMRYRNCRSHKPIDLIELHNKKFTEPKPFQPQLLKTSKSSKITQLKYHNPPKHKTSKNASHATETNTETNTDNKIIVKANKIDSFNRTTDIDTKLHLNTTVNLNMNDMEIDMLDETLGRSIMKGGVGTMTESVPSLNITLDQDHQTWIHNQPVANSAKKLTHEGTLNSTNKFYSEEKNKLSYEEDELRYVEFMQDITTDIVDRGIYNDRILEQIFEAHIARKIGILEMQRMKNIIDKLKVDLGIPLNFDYEANSNNYKLDEHHRINSKKFETARNNDSLLNNDIKDHLVFNDYQNIREDQNKNNDSALTNTFDHLLQQDISSVNKTGVLFSMNKMDIKDSNHIVINKNNINKNNINSGDNQDDKIIIKTNDKNIGSCQDGKLINIINSKSKVGNKEHNNNRIIQHDNIENIVLPNNNRNKNVNLLIDKRDNDELYSSFNSLINSIDESEDDITNYQDKGILSDVLEESDNELISTKNDYHDGEKTLRGPNFFQIKQIEQSNLAELSSDKNLIRSQNASVDQFFDDERKNSRGSLHLSTELLESSRSLTGQITIARKPTNMSPQSPQNLMSPRAESISRSITPSEDIHVRSRVKYDAHNILANESTEQAVNTGRSDEDETASRQPTPRKRNSIRGGSSAALIPSPRLRPFQDSIKSNRDSPQSFLSDELQSPRQSLRKSNLSDVKSQNISSDDEKDILHHFQTMKSADNQLKSKNEKLLHSASNSEDDIGRSQETKFNIESTKYKKEISLDVVNSDEENKTSQHHMSRQKRSVDIESNSDRYNDSSKLNKSEISETISKDEDSDISEEDAELRNIESFSNENHVRSKENKSELCETMSRDVDSVDIDEEDPELHDIKSISDGNYVRSKPNKLKLSDTMSRYEDSMDIVDEVVELQNHSKPLRRKSLDRKVSVESISSHMEGSHELVENRNETDGVYGRKSKGDKILSVASMESIEDECEPAEDD